MPDDIEEEVKTDEVEPEVDETAAETESEEKETPDSSSEETKTNDEPDEESSDEEDDSDDESETASDEETVEQETSEDITKPVEGETPRERALRLEVTRVKEINRGLRGKKLLGDIQPLAESSPAELSDEDKKTLEVFDPEQVRNMEKLLPVLAKKLGFVKKDDFSKDQYQGASQDVLDTWLGAHPDYLPENDKGDILFNRLKSEISMYQKPSNPKDWTKILNRAHNEIMGIKSQPKEVAAQVAAKQEKIKNASHGPAAGGAKKGEQMRKSSATPDIKAAIASGALKGFDESDFS